MTDELIIICATILIILFAGEPDLMDRLISQKQCVSTERVWERAPQ